MSRILPQAAFASFLLKPATLALKVLLRSDPFCSTETCPPSDEICLIAFSASILAKLDEA
jgi:hypothetical protein